MLPAACAVGANADALVTAVTPGWCAVWAINPNLPSPPEIAPPGDVAEERNDGGALGVEFTGPAPNIEGAELVGAVEAIARTLESLLDAFVAGAADEPVSAGLGAAGVSEIEPPAPPRVPPETSGRNELSPFPSARVAGGCPSESKSSSNVPATPTGASLDRLKWSPRAWQTGGERDHLALASGQALLLGRGGFLDDGAVVVRED